MTRVAIIAILTLMWAALWQDLSLGTVLAGVLVSTGVVLVVPALRSASWPSAPRPLATLRFLAAFTWNLTRATADVARAVIDPRRVREGIVAVRLDTTSDWIVTLVANSISVTPGTVTVDVGESSTLFIHVLNLGDLEVARSEVKRLEELAIRAFGPPEDRARLAGRGGGR